MGDRRLTSLVIPDVPYDTDTLTYYSALL